MLACCCYRNHIERPCILSESAQKQLSAKIQCSDVSTNLFILCLSLRGERSQSAPVTRCACIACSNPKVFLTTQSCDSVAALHGESATKRRRSALKQRPLNYKMLVCTTSQNPAERRLRNMHSSNKMLEACEGRSVVACPECDPIDHGRRLNDNRVVRKQGLG